MARKASRESASPGAHMTDKPVIELKSIQVSQIASEETTCFTASLFVDGQRWGTVSNDGRGGADRFHGIDGRNYGHLDILNKRIAATYPKVDLGEGLGEVDANLEGVCSDLVTTFLLSKDLKRALSSKLLFTRSDKEGVFQIPLKQKGRTYTHEVAAEAVRVDKPGFVSLNALPFEEALAIYRANAK